MTPALILTNTGRIVENNWMKIADHNVKTDAFVIMPNHIHGIIIIKSHALGVGAGQHKSPADFGGPDLSVPKGLAPAPDVVSDHRYPQGVPLHKENTPTSKLGSIIGAFKSRCALDYLKYIDENNLNESSKIWQRNYYERIIRDNKELTAIRNYIKTNPANWAKDKENPLNF